MTDILKTLQDAGQLKCYQDYRSGSAYDHSGNGVDGTIATDTLAFSGGGIRNYASNTGITTSDADAAPVDFGWEDTFSFFVRFRYYGAFGSLPGLIGKATSNMGILIGPTSVGDSMECILAGQWAANILRVRHATALVAGTDYTAVVTYDGSKTADGIKIYLDAGVESSSTITDNLSSDFNNNGSFQVGRLAGWSTFDGHLHAAGAVNRVLTASEVSQLHEQLKDLKWDSRKFGSAKANKLIDPTDASLIGGWNMKPTAGVVADVSSNGNDATVYGTSMNKCLLGDCQAFDGVADYMQADDAASLDVSSTVTIEAWLKRGVVDDNTVILNKRNGAAAQNSFLFYIDPNNALRFEYSSDGSTNKNIYTGNDAVDTLGWVHVAVTYDKSATTRVALYVNGVSQTLSVDQSTADDIFNSTADLLFGVANQASPAAYVNAEFGPVAVYNTAKDSTWVAAQYAKGAAALQFVGGFGINDSLASEGDGSQYAYLSNSPFQFDSNAATRAQINTESVTCGGTTEISKVIQKTAGFSVGVHRSLGGMSATDAAYGTWEFCLKPTAAEGYILLTADILDNRATAGQNGYQFYWFNGDWFLLKSTNGATSTVKALGSYTADTYYRIKITRSPAGVFNVYANGTLLDTATDNSHITAEYNFVWTGSTNERFVIASQGGSLNVAKYQGVV